MSKSKKNNSDNQDLQVLDVEALDLESSISTALTKANITKQVLAAIKKKYGKLRLKSIDDKESYLELKTASKEIRKIEIAAEKICELGRADAVKIQRLWISKQKEILAETGETKGPIDADIKRFEDEVERIEQEEKERQENEFINRQSKIFKCGARYENGNYVLGEVSYEAQLIKEADEETFSEVILPKYQRVADEIEQRRQTEENLRRAEMKRMEKEQEEFAEKQRVFNQQQEAFAQQQRDLQKQKDDLERAQRLEQEKKDREAKEKNEATIRARRQQLTELGLYFDRSAWYIDNGNKVIDPSDVELLTPENWDRMIAEKKPLIEQENEKRKIAEIKRLTGIDRYKTLQLMGFELITSDVLAEMDSEKFQTVHDEVKLKYDQKQQEKWEADKKLKEQQEKQKKDEELAAASDREKWAAFVADVRMIPLSFDMKSPGYRKKLSQAKELIEQIVNL